MHKYTYTYLHQSVCFKKGNKNSKTQINCYPKLDLLNVVMRCLTYQHNAHAIDHQIRSNTRLCLE